MRWIAWTVVALSILSLVACGDDNGSSRDNPYIVDAEPDPEAHPVPREDPGPADVEIQVGMGEWYIESVVSEVQPGIVEFRVTNDGDRVHEFVIVQDGIELDEIEGILPGERRVLKFAFEPGTYELACLRVDRQAGGTLEDHYDLGMHTTFVVR